MYILYLFVSFFSSTIGSFCGIGGGIIIKPVLDSIGILNIKTISFMSGCTVLAMSIVSISISLYQAQKNKIKLIHKRETFPLAIGAIIGGLIGKSLFQTAIFFWSNDQIGAIQSIVLFVLNFGTLMYFLNSRFIETYKIKSIMVSFTIGCILGILSSFLGVGGGPLNLVILVYFFSLNLKKAAINSLYIIMLSQFASFFKILIIDEVPDFDPFSMFLMIIGAILGALSGKSLTQFVKAEVAHKLFIFIMILIIIINLFNSFKFVINIL